ncbi:LysR family transcriptional regulator [Puniceibacterium sediminis]|uniref:DNA-binding transcriptional regulator, LysR family n=1 Tax=Puniceibacterium sediminis TaxID=1608407 RepID=A0A238YEK2_9RHOB|nr:LysR family transcriptional regulator [Puniceibacterium sediminis]SNR68789.1 DNA-binding transcriptional regulator, LysR family [Puniceibacterium sediminis]
MTRQGDMPDVSLRLLEIFAGMMRCATTVETAEFLGISQPAVSAGLRQLETQLGISLFERAGRRLSPTMEARDLFEEIRPLFGILRSFSTRARDMRSGRIGRLRVMSTPPLGYSLGPKALRAFHAARPDVTVSYDVRRLENVLDAVQTGLADIGLVLNEEKLETVNSELLGRSHMVVLMPESDPLASEDSVTAKMLSGRSIVGIDQASQLGRLVARGFDVGGESYRCGIEVRYCQTAAALVAEGMGVTVVDPFSAEPYLGRGLVARPFSPACEVRALILTRKGVPHSGLLLNFMEELRRQLAASDSGRGGLTKQEIR